MDFFATNSEPVARDIVVKTGNAFNDLNIQGIAAVSFPTAYWKFSDDVGMALKLTFMNMGARFM